MPAYYRLVPVEVEDHDTGDGSEMLRCLVTGRIIARTGKTGQLAIHADVLDLLVHGDVRLMSASDLEELKSQYRDMGHY